MIHNDEREKIIIGEINFDDEIDSILNEEHITANRKNKLNLTGRLGQCEVWILTKEGRVPHCHIYTSTNQEICVRLLSSDYFHHKDRPSQIDFNNIDQCKAFNAWCHKINPKKSPLTNWQAMCDAWNNANGNEIIINFRTEKQPNYDDLNR